MYDLVVLGGGPGGLSVATAAARAGAMVALVEKKALGGECTHVACVPSKALIAAARAAQQVRNVHLFGLRAELLGVDFAAVMARVRAVVSEFAGGGSGDSLRARGIDVYHGSPAFEAYDTVVIDGATRLNAHRFVIATGSRPAVPTIPGLAESGYLDNRSIWEIDALPKELLILGAGPSGLEFAQAFARLGSKVTVLSDDSRILPREDPEVSERVQTLLSADPIAFHNDVEVTRVARTEGRVTCSVRNKATGKSDEVSGTHLLVAVGRLANVDGLNLDAAGVHADSERGIEVDEYLQTRSTRIFAMGDVLQKHQFTHAAEREADVVFQNAVVRIPRKINYSALPWATFIDPEVATVGLDEATARAIHPEVLVFRAELTESDRAQIEGRTEGFAKVLATPAGKILGATIVGPEAALMLQEFVVAMEHGLTLEDLARTTHIYPTYAGLAHKLAAEYVATRHESSLVRKAVRWFHGYGDRGRARDAGANDSAAHDPGHGHKEPAGHSNGHGH
jgi:pyruvate/2-oxoglutarate dehydrogenase complex dihydrolipoamide dehydrogenase (E3) component